MHGLVVAGVTFGYSPAALERLMDEALVIALTHGRSAMTLSDVAEAKMLVERGVTDETIYTPNGRDRVATHKRPGTPRWPTSWARRASSTCSPS